MTATSKTLIPSTAVNPGPRSDDPGLEYLAGFFDGEGMFRYCNTPELRVSNTDLAIIVAYWRRFGGSVTRVERPKKPHWRTQYIWSCCGRRAMVALHQLLPHLREKRPQADLVVLMRSERSWDRHEHREELSRLKRIDSKPLEGTLLL